MMTFNYITSAWIISKLKELNITRRQLAEALGINETHISRWLSGRSSPSQSAKAAIYFYFKTLK